MIDSSESQLRKNGRHWLIDKALKRSSNPRFSTGTSGYLTLITLTAAAGPACACFRLWTNNRWH